MEQMFQLESLETIHQKKEFDDFLKKNQDSKRNAEKIMSWICVRKKQRRK